MFLQIRRRIYLPILLFFIPQQNPHSISPKIHDAIHLGVFICMHVRVLLHEHEQLKS